MKKNDVFTFTAPNGVEVTGIVVDEISMVQDQKKSGELVELLLCYSQNRLFIYVQHVLYDGPGKPLVTARYFDRVLADYAILPDYDELLARYNDLEVAQAETQSGM